MALPSTTADQVGLAPHYLAGPHAGGAYRPAALGHRGMVSSAHGLATAAGIQILLVGGNAVDAAVAVAVALGVVEPYMSGVAGGGGVMLISQADGSTEALDFVGHAPRATDPGHFADQEAVQSSPKAACVPGMVAGWLAAHERFGRLDRASLFAPAIALAERGAPVTPFFQRITSLMATKLRASPAAAATFLPGGQPPRLGTLIHQPALAGSLRLIAEQGAAVFYHGELGERMVKALATQGGILTMDDLADLKVHWRPPIQTHYRGSLLLGPPPPSTAFQTLLTLRLLEGFDLRALASQPAAADYLHLLIEALKLARADRAAHALGPLSGIEQLLSEAYVSERRRQINQYRVQASEGDRYLASKPAGMLTAGQLDGLGRQTTHFCVADGDGMVVSVTNSLGHTFGCGFMAGDTGLMVNDFGYWLDLDPASPNQMRPGARMEDPMGPVHVINDNRLLLAIGTPGGHGIPQTIAQMLLNALDFGLPIQAAIEAPRLKLATGPGRGVALESRIDPVARTILTARGHELELLGEWDMGVGGGQGIAIDPVTNLLTGGCDTRRDGVAFGLA